MSPRMFPNRIGNVAPVLTLLLVAASLCAERSGDQESSGQGTGNPFDLWLLVWRRHGRAAKGNPERVSCKVTYTVPGSNVSQSIRCAGTDYKFNTSFRLDI